MAAISTSPASPSVTPRELAGSPVKRIQDKLFAEASFRPVSMHPTALRAINTAAEKQLEKGKADLTAALADLSARKLSTPTAKKL